MAEKVICKNPEFLCSKVVWVNLGNTVQAVAGDEDGCSSNTRPMIFAPMGNQDNIERLRCELKKELDKKKESREEAITKAVATTGEHRNSAQLEERTAMPNPLCNQPFRIERFIVLEIPNVGRGAIGREENNGCSSHTRPMLIEPVGSDLAQKQTNFNQLRMLLEQALAAAGSAARP